MNVGKNIKRIRIEKNMTQKELGEKLGRISQQQIARWENGNKTPKLETMQKIAAALGVSFSDLVPEPSERRLNAVEESQVSDYAFIEVLASHKIFSNKDRRKIYDKIENYMNNLDDFIDIDDLKVYNKKTCAKLEDMLLKILLNKPTCDMSDIITLLSCFLSLTNNARTGLIEMLFETCYPSNVTPKYVSNIGDFRSD